MSTNITVVIIMLLGFIAFNLVAVKLYHKPQKDMETYAVGNRKMPWFFVCFTYMAGWIDLYRMGRQFSGYRSVCTISCDIWTGRYDFPVYTGKTCMELG